jgi:hypothetical protein
VKCSCNDWAVNVPILNAPNGLLFARNPTTYKGYTGKRFVFCPWCGLELTEDDGSIRRPAVQQKEPQS